MTTSTKSRASRRTPFNPRNALLGRLGKLEYHTLAPHLEHVELPLGAVLGEPGHVDEYFYFPGTAVISLLTVMRDGRSVEAATVGNEGVTGLSALLGDGILATRSNVQIAGSAYRVGSATLLRILVKLPTLERLLKIYTRTFINQLTQSLACNSLHGVTARCARWLLMTHDRVGNTDTFYLTQESLAVMLGVRREGVSGVSRWLKAAGAIRYVRGRVTIVDRKQLEIASCECYGAARRDYLPLPT
ncbi:MAG TPA: Crp/Fnr family transcriptional regulator [Gemmatimonadaceae bacterium]|nr:Crp/Fnr family transcriptional regulator [Gemmatimonadaceae bacterium]